MQVVLMGAAEEKTGGAEGQGVSGSAVGKCELHPK